MRGRISGHMVVRLLLVVAALTPAAHGLAAAAPCTASAATLQWVQQLVIGRGLCPWASTDPERGFTLLTSPEANEALQMVESEAEGLAARALNVQRPDGDASAFFPPTSLVVVTDEDMASDVGAFANFCQRAQRRVKRSSAGGDVALLGFHPDRLDRGPGCRPSDASDAGHFSVRSPYPTVQVLLESDLVLAREEWAAKRPDDEFPGALGLLLENKRRLRAIGSTRLKRMFSLFSEKENT